LFARDAPFFALAKVVFSVSVGGRQSTNCWLRPAF
jgi:hypothetical protein